MLGCVRHSKHQSQAGRSLRAAGLRVTDPRVAVLDYLALSPHSTVDTIASAVREELGSVSTQAIYDVVSACVNASIVRRFAPPGAAARYELRTEHDHHHAICRTCGAVSDVDYATPASLRIETPDIGGFEVDETEIVFWGTCADCRPTSL